MILTANYTDDNLIKLYERRVDKNDFEGALSILDKLKLSKTYDKTNLYELYAKTLYELEMYNDAIEYWFLFLSNCNEEEKPKAYNALGACYYKIEENSTAGYYFNEQLKLNRRGYFDYNNVGAEFFDEYFDFKQDYYIAYPYDKADFTKLLENTSNMIKMGYYLEALDKLSIIPYNSKFYVDSLMQQSLCRYFLDDKKGAFSDIELACELRPTDINALCNAISLFLSVKNKNKVKYYMQILKGLDSYNSEDNAFKIALIYCEQNSNSEAEEFLSRHLKSNPYDLTCIFLLAICKYNLCKFDDSIALFGKLNRLKKTYVNNYYLNLAISAKNTFLKGKKVKNLNYVYDVQPDEKAKILKSLKYYFGLKKILPSMADELFEICNYVFENSSYNLQADAIIALNSLDSKKVKDYLTSLLLKNTVYDKIKSGIIGYLVADGFYGKINVVCQNLFKTVSVGKIKLDTECTDIFKEAYSVCVAKLFPLESNLEPLATAVNKMWAIVKNSEDAYAFDDVNSLSAVIFELSGIKNVKRRRELANFFNANIRIVKKYRDIFISYGFFESEISDTATEIYDELF